VTLTVSCVGGKGEAGPIDAGKVNHDSPLPSHPCLHPSSHTVTCHVVSQVGETECISFPRPRLAS